MKLFFYKGSKSDFHETFFTYTSSVLRIISQGEGMKLAKLSLAAMVVAGLSTSSFAAETLADAFKEGKISGELRAWYIDRNKDLANSSSDLFLTGLQLRYNTGIFYGFGLGFTTQTSAAPLADETAKEVFGTDLNDDLYGSGTQLSEAYVTYTLGKTTAKVGRQFIKTPLVGSSTSRMITQSFEAALLTNTDLPNTSIMLGAVTKFQDRADGEGGVGQFEKLNNDHDYAYTAMVVNKSIPNVELTAQYLTFDDDAKGTSATSRKQGYKDYYFEAEYTNKYNNFDYGIAANYLYTDWGHYDEATMYGVKVNLGYGDFKTYVAYSSISDDAGNKGVKAGVGGGAQPNYVKGKQVRVGTYSSDTSGFSVDANYNFKSLGVTTGARYTQLDVASKAADQNDQTILDLYGSYKFVGALKGLEAELLYTILGDESAKTAAAGTGKGEELWFKANYKF